METDSDAGNCDLDCLKKSRGICRPNDADCQDRGGRKIKPRVSRSPELDKQIPSIEDPNKAWEYSGSIHRGIHLGPINGFNAPDYLDDSYNGMPWTYGPYNLNNNFHIGANIKYSDSGISISGLYYLNESSELAKIETVQINNHYAHSGESYLAPPDGLFHKIPGTEVNTNGNGRITINITVSYIADIGQGPSLIPVSIAPITIPSLPEFQHFIQTGEIGNGLP